MGPVSKDEIIMLGVFGILLMLWAGIPAMILALLGLLTQRRLLLLV